jgi:pimeloyl-ACP methyl ester carboxylesterase
VSGIGAGGGMFGLYYWNVRELVAEFTTSVIYDRLGTGWSDAVELPRSSNRVTEDLHKLLSAAGAPAPYVLVGHSLGGLYARHFAKRSPTTSRVWFCSTRPTRTSGPTCPSRLRSGSRPGPARSCCRPSR